jgi:ribose-phosphate pyrophosphokinase
MKVFTFPGYERFSEAFPTGQIEPFHCSRFASQELHIRLEKSVLGEQCIILGTVSPPEEQLVLTTLLADTLAREGASSISGVFPYLSYCRQDKDLAKESRGASWLGQLLRISGINQIITLDIHSNAAIKSLNLPVRSISPAPIFSRIIAGDIRPPFTLVSPDKGALERSEDVRAALGVSEPVSQILKQRTGLVVKSELHGATSERAVIIDDILDTGSTLCAAAALLREAGVKEIYIFVTHGLFNGDKWSELWDLGVQRIYCTDTVVDKIPKDSRVTVVGITELLRGSLGYVPTNSASSATLVR